MKEDNNQLGLFGNIEEFAPWRKKWKDMPEFIQNDLKPFRTIEIGFKDYFDEKGRLKKDKTIFVHFEAYEDLDIRQELYHWLDLYRD